MTAYKIYARNESGEHYLIGVLPERRGDQQRITDQSIVNWGRSLLGNESGVKKIVYTTIKIKKNHNENSYPIPVPQKGFEN